MAPFGGSAGAEDARAEPKVGAIKRSAESAVAAVEALAQHLSRISQALSPISAFADAVAVELSGIAEALLLAAHFAPLHAFPVGLAENEQALLKAAATVYALAESFHRGEQALPAATVRHRQRVIAEGILEFHLKLAARRGAAAAAIGEAGTHERAGRLPALAAAAAVFSAVAIDLPAFNEALLLAGKFTVGYARFIHFPEYRPALLPRAAVLEALAERLGGFEQTLPATAEGHHRIASAAGDVLRNDRGSLRYGRGGLSLGGGAGVAELGSHSGTGRQRYHQCDSDHVLSLLRNHVVLKDAHPSYLPPKSSHLCDILTFPKRVVNCYRTWAARAERFANESIAPRTGCTYTGRMRILVLEPYHGGSHKAFLEGWAQHSRHDWTVYDLPARKWKWRMRHAPLHFVERLESRVADGASWDIMFCSDMLNLAEFLGLAPPSVRRLARVAYFHENQLTYPFRFKGERDFHFGFTNMTTALAATQVWFNSAFHRDSFLDALSAALKKMPDYRPLEAVERIRAKSAIRPQGIRAMPQRGPRRPGPMRLLWAARWEHDKNPELFFDALDILESRGVDYRISVIGEHFRESPPVFAQAHERYAARIDRWGFQDSQEAYEAALLDADVAVSTAEHEFFGIGMVEAVAAGAYPAAPRRLAYPETLGLIEPAAGSPPDEFFYEGNAAALAGKLAVLAERLAHDDLWCGDAERGVRAMRRFTWPRLAPELDDALEACARAHSGV